MARPKVKDAEARSFRIRKGLGTRLDDLCRLLLFNHTSDIAHIKL